MSVAAIDIGTNSVRLLVLDEQGRELERHMHITRLGEGVDQTGQLAPGAIQRTLKVLTQYAEKLRKHGTRTLRMTATSAARDATNREAFFGPVAEVLGQEPELLPGSDEARLSFLGATASLTSKVAPTKPDAPHPIPPLGVAAAAEFATRPESFVVFDIGGGSTEFARGAQSPEAYLSLDMGSVRVTERFLKSDPPTPAELQSARSFVEGLLGRVQAEVPMDGSELWVGVAGTVTSFAARSVRAERYDPQLTHGAVLTRSFVREFSETLWKTPSEQRRQLLLEPERAGVIVGGAVILDTLFEVFRLSEVVSSERDILDGLAASLLPGEGTQR